MSEKLSDAFQARGLKRRAAAHPLKNQKRVHVDKDARQQARGPCRLLVIGTIWRHFA